jgi:hypothetical protein
MNYNLNSKKALGKKIEASERELDCDIQLKSGTLVLTCSAAAYEILKKTILIAYGFQMAWYKFIQFISIDINTTSCIE